MVSKAEQKYDCSTEANQQQKDKGKKEKKQKCFLVVLDLLRERVNEVKYFKFGNELKSKLKIYGSLKKE